jgi:hypothetical protein
MKTTAYDALLDLGLSFTIGFLLLGSAFCMVYGVGLLMRSRWVFRLNDWGKRWVSTRQVMRALEAPRDLEGVLYRGHRWSGLVLFAASAYVLAVLLLKTDMRTLAGLLASGASAWSADIAVRAAWIALVIGALAGVVLGTILLVRPERLRRAQAGLNQSFSARRSMKFLEVMNLGPDQWLLAYPRIWGAAITLGSLYIAYSLGIVFLARM